MNKKAILVTIVLLAIIFVSCKRTYSTDHQILSTEDAGLSTEGLSEADETCDNTAEQQSSDASIETSENSKGYEPAYETGMYSFMTYSELTSALCSADSEQHLAIRSDMDEFDYGPRFDSFIRAYADKNTDLLVPWFEETIMTIRGEYEWQKIVLFISELYELPWIWYYCDYKGETVVVGISDLETIESISIPEDSDYREAVSIIAPNAPLYTSDFADNASKNTITDMNIILDGNKNVAALRYYYGKSDRYYYRFILGKCLVSIWAYESGVELTNDFFESFSLKPQDTQKKPESGPAS